MNPAAPRASNNPPAPRFFRSRSAAPNAPPPSEAVERILQGVIEKFYQTTCLVDQGFVKNPEVTLAEHVAATAKKLGDEIQIRRFVRFKVGEGEA